MSTASRELATRLPDTARTGRPGPDLGLAGRVALSGAVAGGVLAGGFAIAALAVAGRMRSSDLIGIGTILYLIGAALGFLHGAMLGWLGREPSISGERARRQILGSVLYLPLPLAAGWAVAGWVATTAGAVLFGDPVLLIGTGFGLAAGVCAMGLAASYGLRAMRNAFARWPERVAGSWLVAAAFAVLLAAFLGLPPATFGGLVPTGFGAVVAAAAITLWLVTPATLIGLRRRRR